MLASRIPRRTSRAAAFAVLVLAVPTAVASCSSGDDSTSSAPTTLAPEEITVPDARVTAGLTAMKTLFADAATAVGSKAASASAFPGRLENEWKQIEGTVKKNEPDVYIDAEDALSAIDKAIGNGDGKAAAAAAADFTTVAEKYLAQHP
jgi:hypothetical protein